MEEGWDERNTQTFPDEMPRLPVSPSMPPLPITSIATNMPPQQAEKQTKKAEDQRQEAAPEAVVDLAPSSRQQAVSTPPRERLALLDLFGVLSDAA